MGPIWGRQDPGGPHVGPVNFAIWGCLIDSILYILIYRCFLKIFIMFHLFGFILCYSFCCYCSDVIMSAVAIKSTAPRLFIQTFVQAQIKENIKPPRHWSLCVCVCVCVCGGGGVVNSPLKGPVTRKMFPFWWRHHGIYTEISSRAVAISPDRLSVVSV